MKLNRKNYVVDEDDGCDREGCEVFLKYLTSLMRTQALMPDNSMRYFPKI